MNRWRSLGLLLVLLTIPPAAQAFTLEDLTVPGAQFAAGPLVFSDFTIFFSRNPSCCALPTSLTDISVVPLDVGGFTLASTWEASGRFSSAELFMTFTAATTVAAPIGDVILSVQQVVVDGNTGAGFFASAGISGGVQGTNLFASANPPNPFENFPPEVIGSLSSQFRIGPTATSRFRMDVTTFGGACSGMEFPCDDGFARFTDPRLTFVLETPEPSAFWLLGLISCALPLIRRRIATPRDRVAAWKAQDAAPREKRDQTLQAL
jgi:hypothetical protein